MREFRLSSANVSKVLRLRHHARSGMLYTVILTHAVYVLHAFQKKSKRGVSTPRAELNLIRQRLKDAEAADAALNQEKSYESKS